MSDERKFSVVDVSKTTKVTSKPGSPYYSGMNLGDIRLLPRWCPAYRQHEPGPGSRVEHVKACLDTASSRLGIESVGRREGESRAAESVRD
jgi:hypothetical protein